jgi:GNAT superfamily N-acetyltransferase
MKFVRDNAPAAATPTDLRVEETLDADAVADAVAEGFGMPHEIARELIGFVGAPGWTCFVAWDGAEPAACGALYCHGVDAWLGIGATRPSFRRRGAQGALLAARIERARAAGARTLTTETGALVDGKPSSSYRNILRAGFTEAYLRPNWRSPQDSRRMLPPETWAVAIRTISSMFTFAGRVSANMMQSETSSAWSGPPSATFE